jgi:hypothetical protein
MFRATVKLVMAGGRPMRAAHVGPIWAIQTRLATVRFPADTSQSSVTL